MNVMGDTLLAAEAAVRLAENRGGLAAFLEPDCAALVWRRETPPDIRDWLDRLSPEHLPRGRVVRRADRVGECVDALCDTAGTPKGAERDWLRADIAELADSFAGMMKAGYLRLRLEAVAHNACRKFHIDAITARLVCTYRGTGTQYGFASGGDEPGEVFTVPAGAPILLRGSLWPAKPASGLLHRSPPIEGSGETRLVLVLDPVFDPEEEM